uniref:RING-type E3 ubiquitin transferase n=1 Tax=Calcidiscus leptoporus TaxID=127549 RepID=A0A7S0J3E2_9EUKA|mmetsp:Transcript_36835/g.86033  ORF Transcript_36835/g.86033 Transcript_36835/m.86033 type:complete len:397 (+) Transcript_36835:25-1215(+)
MLEVMHERHAQLLFVQLLIGASYSCNPAEAHANAPLATGSQLSLSVSLPLNSGLSLTPAPSLLLLRGGAHKESSPSLASLKRLIHRLEDAVASLSAANGTASSGGADGEPVLADPAVGDRVRVRPSVPRPRFEWGDASPDAIGTLVSFDGDRCVVDFPGHRSWFGLLSEMERVMASDEVPAVGDTVRVRADVHDSQIRAAPPSSRSTMGTLLELSTDSSGRETGVVSIGGSRNWTALLTDLELVTPDGRALKHDDPSARAAVHAVSASLRGLKLPRASPPSRAAGMLISAIASQAAQRVRRSESNAPATPAPKAVQQLLRLTRPLGAAFAPVLAFSLVLGGFLGLLAALLDRPLVSLVDAALAILTTSLPARGSAWFVPEQAVRTDAPRAQYRCSS